MLLIDSNIFMYAAVIELHGVEGIVSYDRHFDVVDGLDRSEPATEGA